MEYIDLTLQEGGSGVSDYDLLSNQPQINSVTLTGNKTSSDLHLMSDTNFLPDGYTINLKADGTGDFETIQDAINFLYGKWSLGRVFIHLVAGTYNIGSNSLTIDTRKFNISGLTIYGDATDTTIISASSIAEYDKIFKINYKCCEVIINNLTVKAASKANYETYGIEVNDALVRLDNVGFENFNISGLYCRFGSLVRIAGTTKSTNCTWGIYVENAICTITQNTTLQFTTATYGLYVLGGGVISLRQVQKTYSGVTNEANQTINTIGANGIITGTYK